MYMLLAVALAVLTAALLWIKRIPKNLPPGPPVLPFVGNALSLLKPGHGHTTLQKMVKQYGPLIRVYIGNTLVIVLGDFKTIHEALIKQGDAFSGRPQFANFLPKGVPPNSGLVMSEGDLWKEQRRFALSTLRDFGFGRPILEPSVMNEVEHLLAGVAKTNGRPVDLHKLLNNAVSNVICAMVFSKRFEFGDDSFCTILEKINYRASVSEIDFISPFVLCESLAKLVQMLPLPDVKKFKEEGDEMSAYVGQLIVETKKSYDPSKEPSNYIHAFMKAAGCNTGEYFNSEQLLSSVMDLFMAGTDTTSGTLRWGLFFMAKHPDIQERIYREIAEAVGTDGQLPQLAHRSRLTYTEAALTEIQRIATLAPMAAMHKTNVDTELLGYQIPKGALVLPFLWNVLHNPDYYPDPEEFNPDRFLDEEGKSRKDQFCVPFSMGRRACLGESLAKLELFLFFTALVSRFRFSFPADKPTPILRRYVGFVSSLGDYDLCAEARN